MCTCSVVYSRWILAREMANTETEMRLNGFFCENYSDSLGDGPVDISRFICLIFPVNLELKIYKKKSEKCKESSHK